jgi:hypothetical protein
LISLALLYTSLVSYAETKNLDIVLISLFLAALIYFLPFFTSRRAG